ncbi:FG-GAP-like repeat-containing protein [Cyclobacterium jeungdonense]|uniref:FG-GAP-like repeat-containing protein n=1 Tax=Cyclobacterium jeungdonense TaxID=708087 RepID=A0ABT8C4K8_9BACT|nr:FG-GAP-like repeat-containing protein [Cyclobacterium jeungdonense]MDN3687037.1 FG-GAP-like repeat-containing protein [Cyclobacterium jeungdonense]
MRRTYLLLFLAIGLVIKTQSQDVFQIDSNIRVISTAEEELTMPFAGGINAAQFQQFDLDDDGVEELVIWDINAGRIHAYEKTDTGYGYFRGAEYYFPEDVNGFLLLTDFDQDGKKDLFTGSPFGIKAYRNTSTGEGPFPNWEVAEEFLRLENGSNLTANILDVPLIEDLDGDGDLDVLTFNFATGDYLEYYRNSSVERSGAPGIDGFASAVNRWGNFEFCGCDAISFGVTCGGQPITENFPPTSLRTMHSGGHTLLYQDFNKDGTRDLLIGQDLCQTLYFLPNKATDNEPLFETFSKSLPDFGTLPEFPIFHSAFPLEEKLVVSSHSSEPALNSGADFSESVYLLQPGQSDPVETSAFLQEQMLDFGENSRPYFTGNRLQGNLYVGANLLTNKGVQGRIFEFELKDNTLRLINDDHMELSKTTVLEPGYQQFTNASGKAFHVLSVEVYTNQIPEKKLWISPFSSPEERIEISLPEFTLRGSDQVYLFHDSRDNYLLLARQTGELVLFSISGDIVPEVKLLEREFLNFADNPVSRNLSVAVSSGPQPHLVAIDQRGVLYAAADILGMPEITPVSIQVKEQTFENTRYGRNTWLSFVPGLLGEEADLIVGNRAGGLEYLSRIQNPDNEFPERMDALVFPNPSNGKKIQLIVNQPNVILSVYDSNGKLIKSGFELTENERNEIELWGFPPGLYMLEFVAPNHPRLYKKLWLRR